MRCCELINKLEELAPLECACSWDNVGLLAGGSQKDVKKVLIALDATDEVVEEAVSMGADFLLTHHPLIFNPLKKINDGDSVGRRVLRLIQKEIACYAMHTNFDAAPGCMADLAAGRLGLTGCSVLEAMGEIPDGGAVYGIGKLGKLPYEMSIEELALYVKKAFNLPFLTIYGGKAAREPVTYIAVSPGAGRSMVPLALKAGADVIVTGDIGHHDGIDAAEDHMAVIDAGHYGLEHIFVDFMAGYLESAFGEKLIICQTAAGYPSVVV